MTHLTTIQRLLVDLPPLGVFELLATVRRTPTRRAPVMSRRVLSIPILEQQRVIRFHSPVAGRAIVALVLLVQLGIHFVGITVFVVTFPIAGRDAALAEF
jgi:hypothetical protein